MKCCKKNGWDYIIRYKEGCALSIEDEYRNIPAKAHVTNVEYINKVIYKAMTANVLKYKQLKKKKENWITTKFTWITSLEITDKKIEKIVAADRAHKNPLLNCLQALEKCILSMLITS